MRADGTVKRGEANSVRLEDIHEEPGFNEIARDYDETFEQSVVELAAYIEAGGSYPPVEVRPRVEGGVWLVDGHRRTRALRLLDAAGNLPRNPDAWVAVVPFIGNDAERLLRLDTSSTNEPVSQLGRGRIYTALMRSHGWTVAEISRRSGKTVGVVQRALDLAAGNTDVHQMVKAGDVSPTIAAKAVRTHGDAAGPVLAEQLEQAKAVGKKRVTAAVTKKTVPASMWQRLLSALEGELVLGVETQTVLAEIRELRK
jgi:ParB-like chromosome segregation protein Spo0J